MNMKPRPYQTPAIQAHARNLLRNGISFDVSDCGWGKTYVAAFTAKALGLKLAVLTPKATVPAFRRVLDELEVPWLFVENVERMLADRVWVDRVEIPQPEAKRAVVGEQFEWRWKLPDEQLLLVFDEAHRFAGQETINGHLFGAAPIDPVSGKYVMAMSATLADSPLQLKWVLHQLKKVHESRFLEWCLSKGGCVRNRFRQLEYIGGMPLMNELNQEIVGRHGFRGRVADLPKGEFPENTVDVMAVEVENQTALDEEYERALRELELEAPTAQVVMLRARQLAEHAKLAAMIDYTQDLLEDGQSVVVFVCFRDSLDRFQTVFPDAAVIHGDQTAEERQESIYRFQSNQTRVVVSTIQAGGVGVSLHDLHGGHPRFVLISPSFSARDVQQALGRCPRNGAKTPVQQRLVFAADTMEERVLRKVKGKLDRIEMLNDGDLTIYEHADINPAGDTP